MEVEPRQIDTTDIVENRPVSSLVFVGAEGKIIHKVP